MRASAMLAGAFGLALLILPSGLPRADAADPVIPRGNYRLTLVGPFAETDLILAELSEKAGAYEAKVLDTAALPQPPQVTKLTINKNGGLTLGIQIGNLEGMFNGTPNAEGNYLGMIALGGQKFPAKILKTKADKVTPPPQKAPESFESFMAARRATDAKQRTSMLRDLVGKAPGDPTVAQVYATLLAGAEAGGLGADAVKAIVEEWLTGASAFGGEYRSTVASQALMALSGQKSLAQVTLDLAQSVEKSLAQDSPAQTRADVTRALADAAKSAGKLDLAQEAETRLSKLEGDLDAEYRKKMPPFKPSREKTASPSEPGRVVLMELFTGAQCPPCVAADVAFDALHQVYEPTELVTLQYHLHIPGPDPLTNDDAEKRVEYYPDFGGTPTTIFDGTADAMGGGPLQAAEGKFGQYRQVIDRALKTPSRATIDLKIDRDGDAIKINASAQIKDFAPGESGKIGGSKPKLRLVLVEEEVRYVGGNNLRFHHHVVRSMPGGVDGTALVNGKGQVDATVKLAELREKLETYLSDYVKKGRNFPKAQPPIDLKHLKVVAFVQDDADKAVLNARMIAVPEAK